MVAAAARCKKGARFLLSVEHSEQPGFHLRTSERFAHAPGYVRGAAEAAGFVVERIDDCELRKDEGAWIKGQLLCLRRGR
jgi:predicted TPR repeat methyltransferase